MRIIDLDMVFVVNGRLAIKLQTFAKLLHYSDIYLLRLIKKLLRYNIKIGFKYKKNWYIFLPTAPIQSIVQNKKQSNTNNFASTPSGNDINTDWMAAIENLPASVNTTLEKTNFNVTVVNQKLVMPVTSNGLVSSTLSPKKPTQFIPANLGDFPAVKDYKYGYYLIYDKDKMSIFTPGIGSTIKSTSLPSAFFEICRALDAAENSRNGSNPGLPPRRNLSTTVSFDTGTIAVAATIPVITTIQAGGSLELSAVDYLGQAYSGFGTGENGQLQSSNLPEALLEIASILAAAEKEVTPIENQPNNVQIQFDLEAGNAVISANLPFSTSATSSGEVTIIAIDYL